MASSTNAEIATQFLCMAAQGDVQTAYDRFVAETFRHHNPYFPADRGSLLRAMQESSAREPNRSFSVKHVVASGDHVAVYSHLVRENGAEYAVAHLCRLDEGKIVELWDLAQALPGDSPNELGMF